MASPQLENGYTKVSNELLEALMTVKMSGSEWQYVMCLFRKTYGYNQKEAWVKNAYVCLATGLCKERVSETKKKLLARKIVTEKRNFISLNKNYEEWIELRKNVTVVTEKRNNLLRKSVSIKEKKETINKRGVTSSSLVDLKDKQKASMTWGNNRSEEDDGVVDFDGDGTLKSTAPVSKKKYPNALQVYKVFLEVLGKLPANWKVNKTQLQCAENLFEERGLDKVRNALQFYKEHQEEEFCPQVSTPYDLDTKYTNLSQFKIKHEN